MVWLFTAGDIVDEMSANALLMPIFKVFIPVSSFAFGSSAVAISSAIESTSAIRELSRSFIIDLNFMGGIANNQMCIVF